MDEVDDLTSGPQARMLPEVCTLTVRRQRRNPRLIYKTKGGELVSITDRMSIERRGWSNNVRHLRIERSTSHNMSNLSEV